MSEISRVPRGVPAGGQFAEGRRSEAAVGSLDEAQQRVYDAGYQQALEDVRGTLGALAHPQPPSPKPVAPPPPAEPPEVGPIPEPDTPPRADSVDLTQRPEFDAATLDDTEIFPPPIAADSPFVRAGGVADVIDSTDRTRFYRRRPGIYPEHPSAIRIQADRPLGKQEIEHLRNLAGYSLYARVARKPTGKAAPDSPYSFSFTCDTSEVPDGQADSRFAAFESELPTFFAEGTPQRKSQNGTRKYEGLNGDPISFELYYSEVSYDKTEVAADLNAARSRQIEAKAQRPDA